MHALTYMYLWFHHYDAHNLIDAKHPNSKSDIHVPEVINIPCLSTDVVAS